MGDGLAAVPINAFSPSLAGYHQLQRSNQCLRETGLWFKEMQLCEGVFLELRTQTYPPKPSQSLYGDLLQDPDGPPLQLARTKEERILATGYDDPVRLGNCPDAADRDLVFQDPSLSR